ncbi:MAG: hypothetical protein AAF289_05540, partial [Cyanobacteria bacterium P01_A01_bin.135]
YCTLGLGNAYLALEQAGTAQPYLEASVATAQQAGHLMLEGLSYGALAEAYYQLGQFLEAVVPACLGAYLLKQTGAPEQQAANLVVILRGQLGEQFSSALQRQRPQIVARISVEGYDALLQ